MKTLLRKGIQEYNVLPWNVPHEKGELMHFQDKTAAYLFLRGFTKDHTSMLLLRALLNNGLSPHHLNRFNNQDIIDQLSAKVYGGLIKIIKLPLDIRKGGYKKRFFEEDDYVAPVAKTTHLHKGAA